MKVHFLGHASLLIETTAGNILMDPVFGNAHQEGLLDIFPKRHMHHLDQMAYETLVISHRHLDHFDVATLAQLRRNCLVLIPDDDLIARTLTTLGYHTIKRVHDFDEITLGQRTKLIITRSENRVPEFGLIVHDADTFIWNAVDTIISAQTSTRIAEQVGQVDLLIAPWQPLLENNFQLNRPISFPYERVGAMLEQIARIAPKHVAPGACMFSYLPPAEFMNRLVFPLTLARFTQALAQRCPTLEHRCHTVMPGDTLSVDQAHSERQEVRVQRAASPFVTCTLCAENEPRFSPVDIGVPFHHPHLNAQDNAKSESAMWQTIRHECTHALPHFIAQLDPSIRQVYRQWNVIYQLNIITPNGKETWHYPLANETPHACQGASEFANLESTITAASLHGLIEGALGWDYVLLTGSFRSFASAFHVDPKGLTYPPPRQIIEPLRAKYTYDAQLERVIAHQLAQLISQGANNDFALALK